MDERVANVSERGERHIRVLLVDDHPVVQRGLGGMLAEVPDIDLVGIESTALNLSERVRELRPDVVLLDIRLPGPDGIFAARSIRTDHPRVRIIMWTAYDEERWLQAALRVGAHAYLMKNTMLDELADTIRSVHAGNRKISPELLTSLLRAFESLTKQPVMQRYGLTPEEAEMLALAAAGDTSRSIARRLYRSEVTIKRKFLRMYAKLGVRDRTQAVALAVREGLI